tara:strand:+ start:4854 stop:5051 length:198 start_codon:yes stop_codon:yes gene_type:complete
MALMMTLKDYIRDFEDSQRAFAARLDVTPLTVNRWCAGKRQPRPEMALKIVEATGGRVSLESLYV